MEGGWILYPTVGRGSIYGTMRFSTVVRVESMIWHWKRTLLSVIEWEMMIDDEILMRPSL